MHLDGRVEDAVQHTHLLEDLEHTWLYANGFGVLRWLEQRVDDAAVDAAPRQLDRRSETDGPPPAMSTCVCVSFGTPDYASSMSSEAPAPSTAATVNAGHLIARRLRASGIDTIFTLSGGHLFSIYDGCRAENIRLIDTRHEQTAAFAAEGWSKVTRVPGVAALTAGPASQTG